MGAALLDAGIQATIYAVDLWTLGKEITPPKHYRPATEKLFHKNIRAMGIDPLVTAFRNYSTNVAFGWTKPIDLLYIDGSHAFTDVLTDYDSWHGFVKRGGTIAFHDYTNIRDVRRVINGYLKPSGLWHHYALHERVWSAERNKRHE
jgi:hypothetical protein